MMPFTHETVQVLSEMILPYLNESQVEYLEGSKNQKEFIQEVLEKHIQLGNLDVMKNVFFPKLRILISESEDYNEDDYKSHEMNLN